MKFVSKLLLLFFAVLSTEIFSIPVSLWVGEKNGKKLIIFVDSRRDVHKVDKNDPLKMKNYKFDNECVAPKLINFIEQLAKIKKNSRFIVPPLIQEKEYIDMFNEACKNPLNLMGDSSNTICSFAFNNPKLSNLEFVHPFLEEILFEASDAIDRLYFFPGTSIPKGMLEKFTFSEYINFLKEIIRNLKKYFAENSEIDKENKLAIEEVVEEIALKNLSEFEDNFIMNYMNKHFKKKPIKLNVFLKIFDIMSQRSFVEDDLATRQLFELTDNPQKLFKNLLKHKKNYLQIHKNHSNVFSIISNLVILKAIYQSFESSDIVINYLSEKFSLLILNTLKVDGFKTIYEQDIEMKDMKDVESFKNSLDKLIFDLTPVDPSEIKEISETETKTSLESSSSSIITSDSDYTIPLPKIPHSDLINEIKKNRFIRDCIEDEYKLKIEDFLFNIDYSFNRYNMTLLMLAACEPNASKLVQMLLDFGADPFIIVKDTPSNRAHIPSLIGYDALKFAEKSKSSEEVINILKKAKLDREIKASLIEKECALCKKKDKDVPLLTCASCKIIKYCSKECQKSHWKTHKKDCKETKKVMDVPLTSSVTSLSSSSLVESKPSEEVIPDTTDKCASCSKPYDKDNLKICACDKVYCKDTKCVKKLEKHKRTCKKHKAKQLEVTESSPSSLPSTETSVPSTTVEDKIEEEDKESKELVETEAVQDEEEGKTEKEEEWQEVGKKPKKETSEEHRRARTLALNIVKPKNLGSTGRTKPHNLDEHLAMLEVKCSPEKGKKLKTTLKDDRWSKHAGWSKMSRVITMDSKKIEIHYVANTDGSYDDFKFKD